MKKIEAFQLHKILCDDKFLTIKCKKETQIALVRLQISLQGVSDEIDKAKKLAHDKFFKDELKDLAEKQNDGNLSQEDNRIYIKLQSEYYHNMESSLSILMSEDTPIAIVKMSEEQYNEIIEGNSTWMDLKTQSILYKYLL